MTISCEQRYYENAEIWDENKHLGAFDRARLDAAVALIPATTRSLVDVGAGIGLFLRALEDKGAIDRLIGVERAASARQAAVCRAPILAGSAESLPLEDGSCDMVTAHAVIEHLPWETYGRALAEMERVAGRHIIIDVPYRERRLSAMCPHCGCVFNPHYHMRSFDDKTLRELFSQFQIAEVVKIPRSENVLAAAALPFRRRVFDGFPDYAMCPQCGYRKERTSSGGGPRASGGVARVKALVRSAAARLPHVRTRGDIIVLYERRR